MDGKYLSLTSFKRDGTPVATPMWFVEEDGRLYVATDRNSFKVKRITHNPTVTVAACKASGKATAAPVPAQAGLAPASAAPHVHELMARKYRVDRIVVLPIYRLVQRLRGRRTSGDEVIVEITPGP